MKQEEISLRNFNTIEDEENFYVFRALNNEDHEDIENKIVKIRTDRERSAEQKGKTKYTEQSQISLEEVWNHIKMNHSKETNCISLSSNANVSIDYGQTYHEQYIMLKVPKQQGHEKIYHAGQYMLDEIEERLETEITSLPEDSDLYQTMQTIEKQTDAVEIKKLCLRNSNWHQQDTQNIMEKNQKYKEEFL